MGVPLLPIRAAESGLHGRIWNVHIMLAHVEKCRSLTDLVYPVPTTIPLMLTTRKFGFRV